MSQNIMLDIETMSTQPNAAITAIGAVVMDFENNKITGSGFYKAIDLESSVAHGGHLCPNTVTWWLTQDDAAKRAMTQNTVSFADAMIQFKSWVGNVATPKHVRVWGNGATFDNVIVRRAFMRMGLDCPWPFYGDMCYRTMKSLRPDIEPPEFSGVKHDALADATYQALHLIEIMKALRGWEGNVKVACIKNLKI